MRSFGEFTYRYRKYILVLWVLIVVGLGFAAFKLPGILSGSGFETEGSFSDVEKILQEDFDIPESSLILVFEKRNEEVSKNTFTSFIGDTLNEFKDMDNLASISSPLENKEMVKGDKAYAIVSFDRDLDGMKRTIDEARKELKDSDEMIVGLTGVPVIVEDMNKASQEDLKRAEMIGLPIALVILLFAFGGLVAAAIPLITGFVSVLSTMGLLYIFGKDLGMSIFLLNVVPMIGIALGIDFALLFVNRFREELENNSVKDAVVTTVATSGRAIIFSGLCVILGMAGMLLIQIDLFQTVAIGGMGVVVLSVLAANTFLPALLGVLGPGVNKLMILKKKKEGQGGWRVFATFVMKHPIVMSTIAFVVLIIGILPIPNMNLIIPEADSLPPHYETRVAYETFQDTFREEDTSEVPVVVQLNEGVSDRGELEKLSDMIDKMEKDKIVENVESIFSASGDLNAEQFAQMMDSPETKEKLKPVLERLTGDDQTLLTVKLNADGNSEKAKDWVREWQDKDTELEILLGGQPKFNQEIFDEIYEKMPYGLALILLSTYVILFLAFRSVLIPLKAIIMNVISLSATFGILVWLFQGGHLGLPESSIGLMIPVFTFGIVFGLSMDYEVFLISRMHEMYLESGDNDSATLEGLISTSKIITSAALIMIVVTGAFAFTGVTPVKQMGVSIALAIFIDATLVRMVLVPSLMKLLGDWNWWAPKGLKSRKKNVYSH
ncbi:MMPL family transporter [Pseudalkalibacillus caeni]|uniref:MMPL family transporter n=1 Tax=Exobacillus caeni TaxID=2574798 RepID=A0A5R9FFD6_9BACL|nr:MMPL family transporter [Pseudalkalibacillus caeni]TLS38285.1 MMPL family transporter [Pseudalkalibacillus caeni]